MKPTQRIVVLTTAVMLCTVSAPRRAGAQAAEVQLPAVRQELARRVEHDQQLRQKLVDMMSASDHSGEVSKDNPIKLDVNLMMELKTADHENTEWLKQQVEEHGWLGKTLVGVEGAHHAWLLVQHADDQPKFQQRCLDLMTEMPSDEVTGTDIAYLTDRVLVAAGKPQRYGTQADMVDGRAVVKDVEDEANLDQRRAELGLGPIKEYLQLIDQAYGSGPSE